jgi:hypothetical protein
MMKATNSTQKVFDQIKDKVTTRTVVHCGLQQRVCFDPLLLHKEEEKKKEEPTLSNHHPPDIEGRIISRSIINLTSDATI